MTRLECDIYISGGGIAGLVAACAFGTAGYTVICVDPSAPITTSENLGADLRSTAFLQPARTLLQQAGVWHYLEPHATPLQIMRLVDAGGELNDIRSTFDFNANEISDTPFGWNLPNWLLRREILRRVEKLDAVQFLPGVATQRVTPRFQHAMIKLSDGSHVSGRLVLAADGRGSPIREGLGIGIKSWMYGQKALVFTVSHQKPHDNISTEIHRNGGPFTLVPLPDINGIHHSSVVWMETGAQAAGLMKMNKDDFTQAANRRSCNLLGSLILTSKRILWPVIAQLADRLIGPRTALIAEAAHVIPPIGAQGLNMTLNDVQTLLALAQAHPDNLGEAVMLDAYQRKRWLDMKLRITGVDLLNRAAMTDSPSLKALRLKGLQSLHSISPLRKGVMQLGLGNHMVISRG